MPEENGHRREKIPKRELLHRTTPVPNVILDEWLPDLSAGELKVVLYVARHTRGWSRQWDQISVRQMMDGITREDGSRVDLGVGLRETACREAVRSLLNRGALRREEAVSANGVSKPSWYSLDFSWTPGEVSENRQGRVAESRQGNPIGNATGGRVSENRTHNKSTPCSPPTVSGDKLRSGVEETGSRGAPQKQVNKKVGKEEGLEETPRVRETPTALAPPSDPAEGERAARVKTGDANATPSMKEEPGREAGEEVGYRELARKLEAVPQFHMTLQAMDLGEEITSSLPRIRFERAGRVALWCIETGRTRVLGDRVARAEKNRDDVGDPFVELVRVLCDEQNVSDEPLTFSGHGIPDAYREAYRAVRGREPTGWMRLYGPDDGPVDL